MKIIYLIIILSFAGCVSFSKKVTINEQVFIAVRDAIDNIQKYGIFQPPVVIIQARKSNPSAL